MAAALCTDAHGAALQRGVSAGAGRSRTVSCLKRMGIQRMIERARLSTLKRALVTLRPRKRVKRTLHLARRVVGYRLFLRLGSSYRNLKRVDIIDSFVGYPRDAIPPDYDDLWGLYLIVMERRPGVILELGGGYSTFVFAHAVRQLARQGIVVRFIS